MSEEKAKVCSKYRCSLGWEEGRKTPCFKTKKKWEVSIKQNEIGVALTRLLKAISM